MKKLFYILLIFVSIILIASCGVKEKYKLYKAIDSFNVELVNDTNKVYKNHMDERKYIGDKYTVTPYGRLIIVRIEGFTNRKEYNKLLKDLKNRYDNDSVYFYDDGTICLNFDKK